MEVMRIKDLTKMIEEHTGSKITWELGKKFTAFDVNDGRVVAEYNPRNGKLLYYDN